MGRKKYRWCAVPLCKNTSVTESDKIFIDVPRKADIRKKWFDLANRKWEGMSVTSPIYFCEDHFDLPNNMENYMKFHIMGSVGKVMLKPGSLPSKFDCQPDRKRCLPSTSTSCPAAIKRERSSFIQEALEESNLESNSDKETTTVVGLETEVATEQSQRILIDRSDSPMSRYTPSTSTYEPSSPSMTSLQTFSSDTKSLNEEEAKIEKEANNAVNTLCKNIYAKPCLYIGLTNDCYFLIDLIHKNTCIPTEHILLCLKKIRLNTTFSELADQFEICTSYAGKIFFKNIPIIANILKCFIVPLKKENINIVSCIIDCFEIDIEKPSKSVHQALTWSEYKKRNTMKYLISSTPNGLVNYVSPGYGGRISDTLLVENCEFLEELKPGSWVLADRGFKHIEQVLNQKKCHLLRPPSVGQGGKLTKEEAHETKQIASLGIQIEQVIRRIQEFSMLKPHSVLNSKLISVLDDCVIIACALINLRDIIIQ